MNGAIRDPVRTLVFRLTAVTLVVLLSLSVLTAWSALSRFERVLFPELLLKGQAVAEEFKRRVSRALDYEIPLDQLPGLNEAVAEAAAGHRDIKYAAVQDLQGKVLASHGQKPAQTSNDDIVIALNSKGVAVASFHLSIDPGYLAKASTDLMLEIASVVLVSLLITFEILLLMVHLSMERSIATPSVKQSVSAPSVNLVYLRLPVFLLCLSEELSRPFMPIYAKSLAQASPWIPPELAVSLPITLFMLIWALSQPLGAHFTKRIGRWQGFALAALFAAFGLIASALAQSLESLLVWRCVTALSYGFALIAAQGVVVDHTAASDRAKGLALFIGALLAAGVCGPVIGGIVADQLGGRATFMLGAFTALLAAAMLFFFFHTIVRLVDVSAKVLTSSPVVLPSVSEPSAWQIFRNRDFVRMLIFSAIPAKVAATGILFCLAPLMLAENGASSAEIGRVQMLYFLAFILISPVVAAWSDRLQSRRGFMIAGGIGTLLVLLPLLILPYTWGAPLAIALFGAAQGLISSPQLTMVSQIAPRIGVSEITLIGWYRLSERLGGALGPLLAIALSAMWSYRGAVIGVGALSCLGALLFWILFRGKPSPDSLAEVRT